MIAHAIASYVAVRRAGGFAFRSDGSILQSFATFSATRGEHYVRSSVAIEWAGLARSVSQRARRLGMVIRFARYIRAEDGRHELPTAVFGAEKQPRPVPYILTDDSIRQLVLVAAQSGIAPCAGRPTARCSHCWPAPDFGSQRPSICDLKTSVLTGWSFGKRSFARRASCPCTTPPARVSNGTWSDGAPTRPSTITSSYRCAESRS